MNAHLFLAASLVMSLASAEETADCPSTHPDVQTSGPVTGNGKSLIYFSGPNDLIAATQFAKDDLESKLGRQSGIVCGICPDSGLQCPRSVAVDGTITYVNTYIIEGPAEWEKGWEVDSSYQGSYTVHCAECIPQGS